MPNDRNDRADSILSEAGYRGRGDRSSKGDPKTQINIVVAAPQPAAPMLPPKPEPAPPMMPPKPPPMAAPPPGGMPGMPGGMGPGAPLGPGGPKLFKKGGRVADDKARVNKILGR